MHTSLPFLPSGSSESPTPPSAEGASWVSKTLEAFQFTGGFLPKKIPENVLSPGGTLLRRARRGPIVFTYVLLV